MKTAEETLSTVTCNGCREITEERALQAMKEYAYEVAKESLKNSNFRFEKHYYLDNVDMPFEKHKIRELITDEENIPKEVKS